jgi:hypothetical protein
LSISTANEEEVKEQMEKIVNKKMRLLPLLLVPLLLVPFALAEQSGHSGRNQANGSMITTDTPVGSPVVVSGYTFITYTSDHSLTGTDTGTCNGAEVVVVYPDNTFTFQGTCIFVGTVGGSSPGSFVATYTGTGTLTTGAYTAHTTASDGSGGIAGLEETLTTTGILGATGTYTGSYQLPHNDN